MTAPALTESDLEQITLEWLHNLDYDVKYGLATLPGTASSERADYRQVVLEERLRQALADLNPQLPVEAREDAFRKLMRLEGATLEVRNRALHRLLVEGVTVEYRRPDGSIAGAQAQVIDFAQPDRNHWLVINQFTVVENHHQRRPDLVVFINGLPLVIIELKDPTDENATIWSAYQQLQTYKAELPTLFAYNELLIISDGLEARVGTLTAGREWFKPWHTMTSEQHSPRLPQLQVMTHSVLAKSHLLELVHYFIVYEDEGRGSLLKKMAGYHQFHAVQVAVEETLRAALLYEARVEEQAERYHSPATRPGGSQGDRRIGVVWHTQGSGKSLTMAFYAGRLIREPDLENPTLVILTDRNDLDGQLFATFSHCRDLLHQAPVQAGDRADLRDKLSVTAGGVVFTTIQKFLPEHKGDHYPQLSTRRNIVVIADEAHRSQYDFIDGFARHMRDALPNASFIGFTGTPIALTDKNTRAVFGDYISIYDIQRAVADHATVPIYYESRLAKLQLDEKEKPKIDPTFEEVTEGEEIERKERLKTKWAQLEALVGAEKRLQQVARDLVNHYQARAEAMLKVTGDEGKAMIVCMSRRICVALYQELIRLHPEWHHEDDDRGFLKIVMTGSASDPPEWQAHIRTKARRESLAIRFRDPRESFRIVIVRDMWLTGFDAPSLHTMYIDKPMHDHGLMQAIARVNRVFRTKPGGLVVDYLGLAPELKAALATYTESGGQGDTAIDQEQAVMVMTEKYEICCGLFYGFDWKLWATGTPDQRLSLLPAAQDHILNPKQKDGKSRLLANVRLLSEAFALAVPHEQALAIRDDVAFFQAVKGCLSKHAPGEARSEEELDFAIQQIVSRSVISDQVLDIFSAAGLPKPELSILSEEFLAEVRGMKHRNLALELLRKLLNGEIKTRGRRNLIQARSFAQMLEQTIKQYQNRALDAAQVIDQLIALARTMREAAKRGEQLGLNDDELAFYDALETNDSAVQVLGDDTLRAIARELVATVRRNVTIDWTLRENVRAHLRVLVKRILRKYGYPPDKQEAATRTVLQQSEVLSELWVTEAEP